MTDKLIAWVSKRLDAEEGIINNMNICEKKKLCVFVLSFASRPLINRTEVTMFPIVISHVTKKQEISLKDFQR